MRTRQKYIYDYETNYLVRFRDEKGRYIQKVFGYASKSKKEVLAKAIKWRDENLPDIRKTGKRMLQSKPQRNKKINCLLASAFHSSIKIQGIKSINTQF
jgi:ferritin